MQSCYLNELFQALFCNWALPKNNSSEGNFLYIVTEVLMLQRQRISNMDNWEDDCSFDRNLKIKSWKHSTRTQGQGRLGLKPQIRGAFMIEFKQWLEWERESTEIREAWRNSRCQAYDNEAEAGKGTWRDNKVRNLEKKIRKILSWKSEQQKIFMRLSTRGQKRRNHLCLLSLSHPAPNPSVNQVDSTIQICFESDLFFTPFSFLPAWSQPCPLA